MLEVHDLKIYIPYKMCYFLVFPIITAMIPLTKPNRVLQKPSSAFNFQTPKIFKCALAHDV